MKYPLPALIDLPRLQQLMDTLYQATGINHALIDNDSVVHTAVGWQDICTKFHRVNAETCARCQESDRYIKDHLGDGAYVGYRCPQGLVDYATPVVIEGEHVANIFTGQLLHEPPDIEAFRQQARRYGFDEDDYLEALAKVRILPKERIGEIMAFQVQLAQMLAETGLTRMRQLEAEEDLRRLNRDLQQQVDAQMHALRQLNAELEQRVSNRTEQLEAANRELEEFSYSISHDMRTPLRAVAGFARILLDEHGARLDPEGRRLLGVVHDNTVFMGQLIDGIIEFLRLGRCRMECQTIDVGAMAREVFAQRVAAVPERTVRLTVGELPPAWGDPAMIRRALENLLSNAIKFTRPRAEALIEINGRADAGESLYCVRDNGVGFDMKYQSKLFKVFERVHAPGEFEGTAIGLAVVKRVVGRHGGRVWAEGKIGEGAAISFSLPGKGKQSESGR
ncbi:MAG: PocR ligand-binding domain-containing protein [Rhodocyclaceae bacterium]|jgi:signal transduction histidine kinase|nr:PocR ligand-binding domain-containing protein [Rhodocyclaceae bacterium]